MSTSDIIGFSFLVALQFNRWTSLILVNSFLAIFGLSMILVIGSGISRTRHFFFLNYFEVLPRFLTCFLVI